MDKTLLVKIITPIYVLFESRANIVTIPGEEGEFGVLPLHAPLMAVLKAGIVKISEGQKSFSYFIYGGLANVSSNEVDVVTEFGINLADVKKSEIVEKINKLKISSLQASDSITESDIAISLAKYESLLSYL